MKPISEYKHKVSLEIEGTKEKHKMRENAGILSNAESNENSNSMTQGTDIHQLQDIRGSLKEPEKDKTETKHIQERSSTITQNSGITATQIPQSPALLHDELNMLKLSSNTGKI
jgi:hypothetical protein